MYSDNLRAVEKDCMNKLEEALHKEHLFWKEKSKVNWNLEADINTNFFHIITLIKSATKNILALNIDGSLVSNQEILSNHVVDHFKNLFSSPVGNYIDHYLIKDSIPTFINQDTNQRFTEIPSDIEIKEVVFNLNKDGTLGSNGFGDFFFQHFWDIILQDVIMVVKQFFISSWIMPNYNANTLILLPKVPNVDSIELFRPLL